MCFSLQHTSLKLSQHSTMAVQRRSQPSLPVCLSCTHFDVQMLNDRRIQPSSQLGAGSNPALLGPKAFSLPWLSQAILDHCYNVGLTQDSLHKTLMRGSEPSPLLASRAMAGEREISVMGNACQGSLCTACCQQQLLKLSQ